MGLGSHIGDNYIDCDTVNDNSGDGGGSSAGGKSFGHVSCSICLEGVTDEGDRSWAKLQCGHLFHLDCIGSAFNVKGAMQCPNCRKIEKGCWLYANGGKSFPEFSIEEWTNDEDLYDPRYSEMSFGVHWCPFGSVTRLPPSFEDGELSSSSYYDPMVQHPTFAEPTIPSATHPCPYIAYVGSVHPSSSNSSASVSDTLSFNNPWTTPSVPGEMPASYAFPSIDLHYHSWEHHSSRVGNANQPRSPRYGFGLPGSAPFLHHFAGHSSNARGGGLVTSSMAPRYSGSSARSRGRVQTLQAYYQLLQPNGSAAAATQRSIRGIAQAAAVASSSDLPSRNFSQEDHIPVPDQFRWERDHYLSSSQEIFHQAGDMSEPGLWYQSFRQRHGF